MMPRTATLALMLVLAACGGGAGPWSKPGVDAAAAARDRRECRGQAEAAFATDRSVDADILASRGQDWQRAGTLEPQQSQMHHQASGHAEAVFAACMRAKGYTQPAKPG